MFTLARRPRSSDVSRPSFADVVAIDLATGEDRLALPDGRLPRRPHGDLARRHAGCSCRHSTAQGGRRARHRDRREDRGEFPSGDSPHESNYSQGRLADLPRQHRHASTPPTDRPGRSDTTQGRARVRDRRRDRPIKVLKQMDMGQKLAEAGYPGMSAAVRPMAIAPDERYVYFQVSFFHGIVEFDLRARTRSSRVVDLPLSDGRRDAARAVPARLRPPRPGDEPAGHEALRRRDDVRLRGDRRTATPFELQRRSTSATKPYWSTTSDDGQYCFVSVSGDDRVAVISLRDRPRGRADPGRRPPAADAHRDDRSAFVSRR